MKDAKFLLILFISLLLITIFSTNINMIYACSHNLKNIKTFSTDTTGNKKKETIEILADEEKKGYIVKVVHADKKVYELKPDKEFEFLAPYTPFWKLNIIVADINTDDIPEIITWGSMTHENPIHIFRWNGSKYEIIFRGFYTGFSFRDITGDSILELVISNRIYGTGYESIYYQWQDNAYNKIFYEFDGARGFPVIEQLLTVLPETQQYISAKEALSNFFTDEWINNENNIKLLKSFSKDLLNIQILEYDLSDIQTTNTTQLDYWKFKVKTFRVVNTSVVVKESTMIVGMKLINNNSDKNIWRIDKIEFLE